MGFLSSSSPNSSSSSSSSLVPLMCTRVRLLIHSDPRFLFLASLLVFFFRRLRELPVLSSARARALCVRLQPPLVLLTGEYNTRPVLENARKEYNPVLNEVLKREGEREKEGGGRYGGKECAAK